MNRQSVFKTLALVLVAALTISCEGFPDPATQAQTEFPFLGTWSGSARFVLQPSTTVQQVQNCATLAITFRQSQSTLQLLSGSGVCDGTTLDFPSKIYTLDSTGVVLVGGIRVGRWTPEEVQIEPQPGDGNLVTYKSVCFGSPCIQKLVVEQFTKITDGIGNVTRTQLTATLSRI